jgi:hypothetical protein
MARAAAKRNQGASKAARPVDADQAKNKRKAEKSLEDELFFNRLRGHAKWVFVLLAVVFGASFVFLGVGSGNAGLSDVFSNVFGGGGGPSIESLQKKVAEAPRDLDTVTGLAQALEADGRTEEAIAAYRTYLAAKPKDRDALSSLALLYQNQAALAAADATTHRRGGGAAPGPSSSLVQASARHSGPTSTRSPRRRPRRLRPRTRKRSAAIRRPTERRSASTSSSPTWIRTSRRRSSTTPRWRRMPAS